MSRAWRRRRSTAGRHRHRAGRPAPRGLRARHVARGEPVPRPAADEFTPLRPASTARRSRARRAALMQAFDVRAPRPRRAVLRALRRQPAEGRARARAVAAGPAVPGRRAADARPRRRRGRGDLWPHPRRGATRGRGSADLVASSTNCSRSPTACSSCTAAASWASAPPRRRDREAHRRLDGRARGLTALAARRPDVPLPRPRALAAGRRGAGRRLLGRPAARSRRPAFRCRRRSRRLRTAPGARPTRSARRSTAPSRSRWSGSASSLANRANLTNVGGEGQIAIGGMVATAVALYGGAAALPLGLALSLPLLAAASPAACGAVSPGC